MALRNFEAAALELPNDHIMCFIEQDLLLPGIIANFIPDVVIDLVHEVLIELEVVDFCGDEL